MFSIIIYSILEFGSLIPIQLIVKIHNQHWIYLNHCVPLFCVFLYYRFSRMFLNLPQIRPELNKQVIKLEYFILGYSIISPLLFFTSFLPALELIIFLTVCILIGIISVLIINSFLKKSNPLTRFAMVGAAFLLTGSITTVILKVMSDNGYNIIFDPYLPLLFFVIAELLTFTTGLGYKTRLIEAEKFAAEQKLISELEERHKLELEVLQMRNNIARDIHDEISSGLSKISLMGEVIRRDNKNSTIKIDNIISSSKDMMEGLADLIWTLNVQNDRLDTMLFYIRRYAMEYLDNTGIDLSLDIPDDISPIKIPILKRRNTLLVVKEALHNALKYSNATNMELKIQLSDSLLCISIHDNGIGYNNSIIKGTGNGLKNMKTRMEALQGSFQIENKNGTLIHFRIPI